MKVFFIISCLLFTERHKKVLDIIEREPLSVDNILKLSHHCQRYLIPVNQSKSKRHAIILYNTESRDGAEYEAANLEDALKAAGYEVRRLEWSHTYEVGLFLESALKGVLGSCSQLTVCIMSHGYRGVLRGSEGSRLLINDIVHQLTVDTPSYLPLVRAGGGFTFHLLPRSVDHYYVLGRLRPMVPNSISSSCRY